MTRIFRRTDISRLVTRIFLTGFAATISLNTGAVTFDADNPWTTGDNGYFHEEEVVEQAELVFDGTDYTHSTSSARQKLHFVTSGGAGTVAYHGNALTIHGGQNVFSDGVGILLGDAFRDAALSKNALTVRGGSFSTRVRTVSISGASEAHSLSVTDNELHVYDVDAAGASVHTVYAQKVTGEFQQNALRLENVILKSVAVVGVSAGYPKPTGTIRAVGNVGSAAGSTLRTAYGADVNYGDAVVEGNELHLSDVTMRAEYNSDNHFFGQISKAAGPPRSPRERSRSPAPSARSARPTTIKTSISQAPTRSPGAPRRAA